MPKGTGENTGGMSLTKSIINLSTLCLTTYDFVHVHVVSH